MENKKILILGGTSTTHQIVKILKEEYIISVATEYGFETFSLKYPKKVVFQRFDAESLEDFIKNHNIVKIIDTTHPFAKNIKKTAKEVAKKLSVNYESKVRDIDIQIDYDRAFLFDNYEEIVEFLKFKNYGSILFTIGSNNIDKFKEFASFSYVRVLPFTKSIELCLKTGFEYKNIIAMQGPFSENLNIAFIDEFQIDCVVTKNSGKGSGFKEKLSACKKRDIDIVILGI